MEDTPNHSSAQEEGHHLGPDAVNIPSEDEYEDENLAVGSGSVGIETSDLRQVEVNSFESRYRSDPTIQVLPKNELRMKLRKTIETQRFQVFVILFVILDCIIVISELLMDLRLLTLEEHGALQDHSELHYVIPDVLHTLNIAILALFSLEMLIKILAYGLSFFKLKWEVFDVTVIITTFVMEAVYQHSHSAANGFGLLIILRLWRVARILNGIVKSVKVRAERRLECERRRREITEEQLERYRQLCHKQQMQIIQLEKLLSGDQDTD